MPKHKSKVDHVSTIVKGMVEYNPLLSDIQIAEQMSDLGLAPDKYTAQRKIARRRQLQEDIAAIRAKNFDILNRDIVPLALKIHKKALKSKKLSDKEKFPYVKLAEDKVFGEQLTISSNVPLVEVQALIQQAFNLSETPVKISNT